MAIYIWSGRESDTETLDRQTDRHVDRGGSICELNI